MWSGAGLRNLGSIFLPGVLGLALVTIPSQAHPEETCEVRIEEASAVSPPLPPIEGAAEFADEISSFAGYLLTEKERKKVVRICETLRKAGTGFRSAENPEKRLKADLLRVYGEKMLLEFLETLRDPVRVDLASQLVMETTRYRILPGDTGVLFLRIDAGEGPTYLRRQEGDLNYHAPVMPPMEILFHRPGTTWVLMRIRHAPVGRTVQEFNFVEKDEPDEKQKGVLLIETPPTGLLDVRILDEHGRPTPAMVRITSGYDRRVRRPPGALDWRFQMDLPGVGTEILEGGHFLNIPGPFRGIYWCVPEPFRIGLSEGEWELHIRRGIETVPIHDTVQIRAGQVTKKEYRLSRWTNMAARGWYSGDDHIHSRMISSEDARKLMIWLQAEDLHVGNVLQMGDHLRTYFQQAGFGPDFRFQKGNRVLVPGQEDPRFVFGHAIGLNIRSMVRDESRYLLNVWVAGRIHEQGGLYGHAHLAGNLFQIVSDMTLLMPLGKSDFGEILQFNTLGVHPYYDFLDLGFKLAASSGSDVPYGSSLGECRVYAYLGNKYFSPDGWFSALERGRTFVTNGPMIDFRIGEAYPGDEIVVSENRSLKLKVVAWGLEEACAPKKLTLVRFGEVLAEVTSEEKSRPSLELEMELDTDYGFWVAAAARGWDGTVAHTTPIYVRREGFRFWNFSRVRDLLEQRLKHIDALEEKVRSVVEEGDAGNLDPNDFHSRRIYSSGRRFLEFLEPVRAAYRRLGEIFLEENRKRPRQETDPGVER